MKGGGNIGLIIMALFSMYMTDAEGVQFRLAEIPTETVAEYGGDDSPAPQSSTVEEAETNEDGREGADNSDRTGDSDGVSIDGEIVAVEATYYTAFCKSGCIGITRTGVDVSETIYYEGRRIIAVDPDVIPLGSVVYVKTDNGESFEATAQDTGGAIQGARIDILVEDHSEAMRLGRVGAEVTVIKEGTE